MDTSLETICAHAGAQPDKHTGAVTAPIYFSTTFHYEPTGIEPTGNVYSREGNPTRNLLEETICKLEGGVDAAAFSSGSAAAQATFMSLSPGNHVVVNFDVYAGVRMMLKNIFIPWGLEVTFADLSDAKNVRDAIKPNTKLVWAETPTNPQLKIIDLKAVIAICKPLGILTAIDNTFATPILQNPIRLGADLVMHSTTKYLGGHSDLTGGALITAAKNDWWKKIRHIQHILGAVPSPFDCWLLMRGIRSLIPRMQLHTNNAQAIAEFLSTHPKVRRTLYPGLPSHPSHDIAKSQMKSYGAIVSILVNGTKQEAINVAKRLKVFTNATSLGGTESLVEHRKTAEGLDSPTPDNLLRLSVGLENVNDLIEDLTQALQ